MTTTKTSYYRFRQIRTICEEAGSDSEKLDQIHKIADEAIYIHEQKAKS